jgi:glutamate mutase epsilon subunit
MKTDRNQLTHTLSPPTLPQVMLVQQQTIAKLLDMIQGAKEQHLQVVQVGHLTTSCKH